MGAEWVAGGVRARALARRRVGAGAARRLAGAPSLSDALRTLADTPYGHDLHLGQSLADAEQALGQTLLWHLRVLAGWLPRTGVDRMRVLAGWFELANLDQHVGRLAGGEAAPAYRLGSLATGWPRLAATTTLEELREALAASVWGDPGAASPWALAVGPRLAWAERLAARVPAAAPWAAGAVALLLARETVSLGRHLHDVHRRRVAALLGPGADGAGTLAELARRLTSPARWALEGIDDPAELWRAEARWWTRVEHDGFALLRRSRFDADAAVGVAAVLATDAWRVRAALESAARGGTAGEVFGALG